MNAKTKLRKYSTTTERLELRALERMIGALLKQIELWMDSAKNKGRLRCKESSFQTQAFLDRRNQAMALLGKNAMSVEPMEIRITRLEQMVESLQCSREFFKAV